MVSVCSGASTHDDDAGTSAVVGGDCYNRQVDPRLFDIDHSISTDTWVSALRHRSQTRTAKEHLSNRFIPCWSVPMVTIGPGRPCLPNRDNAQSHHATSERAAEDTNHLSINGRCTFVSKCAEDEHAHWPEHRRNALDNGQQGGGASPRQRANRQCWQDCHPLRYPAGGNNSNNNPATMPVNNQTDAPTNGH